MLSRVSQVVNLPRKMTPAATSFCNVFRRNQSSSVAVKGQVSNTAAYKRGRGGRSSFNGVVATVLGATGFMGRYIVNRLGKVGTQVIVPYRGEPYHCKELRLMGDLGQILFLKYHLRDEESLRKVMKYSNVVINLVGREYETKNFTFDDVNVDGAATVARIAKEVGVEKLIHFSHLSADPDPPSFYRGGSEYLETKYYGEEAVREHFPEAIIIKPADIYGEEDRFIRYYARPWRRWFNVTVPLYKRGTETIKMPVCCSDVAEGVVNAINDKKAVGRNYEFVGPRAYYLSDLIDYFYRCMRWPFIYRVPVDPLFRQSQWALSLAPNYPLGGLDKLETEFVSDVIRGPHTLETLGVNLSFLEDKAPYHLRPFRRLRYYEETVGEFPEPVPPPHLDRLNLA